MPLTSELRTFDTLCLGLNAHDHLCLLDDYPTAGGKERILRMVECGGGQSATAACCLARLGWRTAYAGVAGDDEAGQKAGPWLEGFGVAPLGLITKPGAGSQQAWIMVETRTGERTIFWRRDDACRMEPSDINPELIAASRVLHLDGHFLEASLEAAAIARRYGVLISLDGERVYPGTEELVKLCHVVVGCSDYANRLTGIDDNQKALKELARMGPLWVGRTEGEKGAWLLADGQLYHQEAFCVKVVDTTGAGDVFHAGLVHAILAGASIRDALRVASAVAAISVRDLGGRTNLPDRQRLLEFLEGETS